MSTESLKDALIIELTDARESFYRSRKPISLDDLARYFFPTSDDVAQVIFHMMWLPYIPERKLGSHQAFLQYRRFRERVFNQFDRGAYMHYSVSRQAFILDESSVGLGIKEYPNPEAMSAMSLIPGLLTK